MKMELWRFPLQDNLKRYAQYDSSLLMECWQLLKKHLQDGCWEESILNPIVKSNANTCKMVKIKKPTPAEEDMIKYRIPQQDIILYKTLHMWRIFRARHVDEKPTEVLTNPELAKLVTQKPANDDDLKSVFHNKTIPRWIIDVTHEIFHLVHPPKEPENEFYMEFGVDDNEIHKRTVQIQEEPIPDEWIEDDGILIVNAPKDSIFEEWLPSRCTPEPDVLISEPIFETSSTTMETQKREHCRLVKAPENVPAFRKKWIPNPPQKPPSPKNNEPGALKRKRETPKYKPRPHGVPRKRKKPTPELKIYGQRRRSFNKRQRKLDKQLKVTVEFPSVSSPKSTFGGGMCRQLAPVE